MGLDLGLEKAGFNVVMAADNMPAAGATIMANRPRLPVYRDDIRQLDAARIQNLTGLSDFDLLAGGPPCQSFSTAGKRLSVEDEASGNLVFEFIRLLGELRPKAFLMENVKGILSASLKWRELPYNNNGKRIDDLYGSAFRQMTDAIKDLGYTVDVAELNAADYGVSRSGEYAFSQWAFATGKSPAGLSRPIADTPVCSISPGKLSERISPIWSKTGDIAPSSVRASSSTSSGFLRAVIGET